MKKELHNQHKTKMRFLDDVAETQYSYNNFAALKKAIVRLYKVWVLDEAKGGAVSKDSAKYHALKRSLLEQKYDSLKIRQASTGKNIKEQTKSLTKEN
jgi:hypothetical protein